MTRTGIVHVGVGAFFRAHQAVYLDRLLQADPESPWGVCGVGLLPGDATVLAALRAQGCTYSVVVKHPDGEVERTEVRSLRQVLSAPDDVEAVLARLADPGTHVVSLTVTEGGYGVDPATGRFDDTAPAVVADAVPGAVPSTLFGVVVEALRRRRASGVRPFTVLSCDNLEGNGHVARTAFTSFARMLDRAADGGDLAGWIEREVAFPSSMVDRITPVTTQADRDLVRDRWGVEDAVPVTCEPYLQWVLEDDFCDGRPPLETVGVQLVDDVRPYELMKLRLLNGGHQALAHAGLLLGHVSVADAATDPDVVALLRAYLAEAVRTLEPVPGVDLDAYQESLLARFVSRAVPDTLARLAAHASDRVPGFVLPVLVQGLRDGLPVPAGAAVVAAWLHRTEAHPETVVDRREDGRTPEQLLADRDLFGDVPGLTEAVLAALELFRRYPARTALVQQTSTPALPQWGSGTCRRSRPLPTVDA
ncbi:MAG: mannitol dehydrogenase-like protein [Frankiales bacterium]|nr:mannitol dehydrogenase-like protein [Frankiales bacterium]